jgi:hypothetical protein
MISPTGQLEKMLIQSYKDPKLQPGDLLDKMEVIINPENYAQEFKIEYNEEQGEGTSASPQSFTRMPPQEMNFEFLFDRTGALPGSPTQDRGVMPDIEQLKSLTYEYKGDFHRPPYLDITWGELYFKCVLVSLNVQYKLFRPDGTPVRAVVSAAFKEFKDEEQRTAEENDQSPDLTHLRTVRSGDRIDLMAHRIYGDPAPYLEVARRNGLINFRRLRDGQELEFPPIEKK